MRISDWSSDVCSSDRWDAGAKRMFMRQLVDAGGETADGGRSPFAEAGADIARKKEAIAARLASADDRDGRFGETFDAALHEQPVRRAFEVEQSGRKAGRTTKQQLGRASCRERVCQYG